MAKMKLKALKIAVLLTLAAGLVVGLALPGLAASDEAVPETEWKPLPRILRGVVDTVDDENQEFFTVQVGERSVEIEVDEATRYFRLNVPRKLVAQLRHRMAPMLSEGQERAELTAKPTMPRKLRAVDQAPSLAMGRASKNRALLQVENRGLAPNLLPAGLGKEKPKHLQGNLKWLRQFGEKATFDDMAVGDRVVVGVAPGNGKPLAKLVLIIKPAAYDRVSGTILGVDEDTITIDPASDTEDEPVILIYDEHTTFVLRGTPYLETGMKAVAIYVETDDGLLAKRVMARVQPLE